MLSAILGCRVSFVSNEPSVLPLAMIRGSA